MSWTRNVSFYFFVFVKLPVMKLVSLMEISRNPINYLPIMLLFIHRRYELSYRIFYNPCALSPRSLSSKSIYISYWLWHEFENFSMEIISHMTDGNQFLNRGISFSLRKPTHGNIYERQPQNSLTLLSVKIAADQLRTNWSSVSFCWIRVWAIGKY